MEMAASRNGVSLPLQHTLLVLPEDAPITYGLRLQLLGNACMESH